MEDWAAPIVVTTDFRLFESLFARDSAKATSAFFERRPSICSSII